jgi:hypothetical protein
VPPGLRTIAVVPSANNPRLTVAERMALTVRNAATASGKCACGAVIQGLPDKLIPREFTHIRMVHEDDCPAISKAALRAMRKIGGAS